MTILLFLIIIPPFLPFGTPEPTKETLREGYYKVKGKDYSGLARVKQPEGANVYIVSQYVGGKETTGIGFFYKDTLTWHWDKGVMAVHFKNGKGNATWASNPGNGRPNHETWMFLDDED